MFVTAKTLRDVYQHQEDDFVLSKTSNDLLEEKNTNYLRKTI